MLGKWIINPERKSDLCMCETLIVEDNAVFRSAFQQLLHARFPNMVVDEAHSGKQALQKLKRRQPAYAFVDIRLPDCNGLELVCTIKKERPDLMVAVLTSYDTPEYREAAMISGANHFLVKGKASDDDILSLLSGCTCQQDPVSTSLNSIE